MRELQQLQDWYQIHCNGDWEHSFGIKIDTLDNPGWMVVIDLAETKLDGKPFERVSRGNSDADADWLICKSEASRFIGHGGANNLTELLRIFLNWAKS